MNTTTPSAPFIVGPGKGETISVGNTVLHIKAASPHVTVVEYTAPAGFPGPPLHVHPAFDEVFYVLDGTLSMRVADAVHDLSAGGSAFAPGEVPHTFANTSADPARFLLIMTPGGFEDFFRAVATGDDEGAARAAANARYAPA